MGLLAVKHMDPVVGVDVHAVIVAPSPTPVFLPHPHVGFVLDLREYVSAAMGVVGSIATTIVQEKAIEYLQDHPDVAQQIDQATNVVGDKLNDIESNAIVAEGLKLDADITGMEGGVANASGAGVGAGGGGGPIFVNGFMRTTAGTHSFHVPGLHFPLGESFAPVPPAPPEPSNDSEAYMGSRTVLANNDPMSFMALPAMSCWSIGEEPIAHNGAHTQREYPSMPSSVMLPIPVGRPVLVGGPPVMNMAAAAAGLFKAFQGSNWARALADKLHLKPGFLRCKVLKAEPVDATTGEVVVQQRDFTIAGRLPLVWERHYASHETYAGSVGVGWQTPADIRLELTPHEGGVGAVAHFPDHATAFDALPEKDEWPARVYDWQHGHALYRRGGRMVLRTREGIEYWFSLPAQSQNLLRVLEDDAPLVALIERMADLNGNAWLFERDHNGDLLRVVERDKDAPTGRIIECEAATGAGVRILTALSLIGAGGRAYPLVRYEHDREMNLVAALDAMANPRRFEYEEGHRLVRHVSARGVAFHYKHREGADGVWRVERAWGDDGLLHYRFAYDRERRETRIADSLGRVAIMQLNERGMPVAEIDVQGGVTSYRYDSQGRTCTEIDAQGRTTQWEYDAQGNLLAQLLPDGSAARAEYDSNHKPVCLTAPGGRKWRYEWDDGGNLVARISPSQATSRYAYDASGRLTSHTGPNGATTRFGYDRYGNLSMLVDALGNRTRYERDARGNVRRKVDAAGRESLYEHDPNGKLTRAIESDGGEIHCAYDPDGNLVRYRDAAGNITRLTYTALGEIAERLQPDGSRIEYRYDTEGQLIEMVNECGERYRLARDALGRIVEEIDYWGQSRRYEYSATGELRRSVDPEGQAVDYRYDAVGRIVEKLVPDPGGKDGIRADCFSYDRHGDLVLARNACSTVEFRYDADGRLIEERQGDDFSLLNRYDAAGNRVERKTRIVADGHIVERSVCYTYDALDAVVGIATDRQAPIVIERDAIGQIRSERLSDGLRRESSYEANGRLSKQTLLAGTGALFAVEYSYDAGGDLVERRDSRMGLERFEYDPVGNLTAHVDPAGAARRFLYDPAGNLLRTRVRPGRLRQGAEAAGAWLREGEHDGCYYAFDCAGNLVRKRSAEQDVVLRWDAAGQLTETLTVRSAEARGSSDAHRILVRYRYDAFQRRIAKITSTQHGDSGAACQSRIRRFFWDSDVLAGEHQAEFAVCDQFESSAGRACHPVDPASEAAAILAVHEPLNVPLRQDVREWVFYPDTFRPLTMSHCTLDTDAPFADPARDGSRTSGTLFGEPPSDPARLKQLSPSYAPRDAAYSESTKGGAWQSSRITYFFHNDPNGAAARVTDDCGHVVWEASNAAWAGGSLAKSGQPLDQPLRLQGQYYDDETGLCYNRYRYYDHAIGQFVSQDPCRIDGGANLYRYAPNPAIWIDPYGLANTIDGQGNTVPILDLGIPDKSLFKPKSGITTPYSRNSKCGPTAAQTKAVQNKPCVACNATAPKMVADHIDALVVEYYRTGANDVTAQTAIAAVQPHCPDCSRSQGGKASAFSSAMKKDLGI